MGRWRRHRIPPRRGCFFDPQGRQTSYFVADGSRRRDIHGPNAGLPWDTATEIEPTRDPYESETPKRGVRVRVWSQSGRGCHHDTVGPV